MAKKIMSGFPLRPCSWLYAPIAPAASTRLMFQWLDSVCGSRVAQRYGSDRINIAPEPKAAINGT